MAPKATGSSPVGHPSFPDVPGQVGDARPARKGRPAGVRWAAGTATSGRRSRADWRWTLPIALPDEATDRSSTRPSRADGRKVQAPYDATLRIERFEDGRAAQILHVGSYADERPSIERLHAAIAAAGLHPDGRHHEIHLGDPSRTAPARLRTLLRMPAR